LSPVGRVDDFEFYPTILSASDVRSLVHHPSLQFDFGTMSDISNQNNWIYAHKTPQKNGSTANFAPGDLIQVGGPGLNLSDGFFTFATWIRPVERGAIQHKDDVLQVYPAFETEGDHTWQFIAGNEIYRNIADNDDDYETVSAPYPTLAHDNDGRLRIRFGQTDAETPDESTLCTFETPANTLTLNDWQYLTVVHDASQFSVYLNGELAARGVGINCAGRYPLGTMYFYIGNSSPNGYLHLNTLEVYDACDNNDCMGNEEMRIDLDSDTLWGHDDVEFDTDFTINVGRILNSKNDYTFRIWEDDGWTDDNDYESEDDSYYSKSINRTTRTYYADEYDNGWYDDDYDSNGKVFWGVFDYFFAGELRDFRVYNYTMNDAKAADLYNTNYYALQLRFDEAPGEDIFDDTSGNAVPIACDSNARPFLNGTVCPDSGIPGRNNQSLRFDGVDDYLTISTPPVDLGLGNGSFTVMAWVKLDSLTGDQTILGSDQLDWSDWDNDIVFAVRDGQPYMRYGNTSINLENELTSDTTLNVDEWYHLAWVYGKESERGNNETATMSIYLNGNSTPIATIQETREIIEFAVPVIVGNHGGAGYQDPSSRHLDGLLDDLAIARKVLSPAEILAASLKAPVLNLHLDEDYGNLPFADETNNNNDAVCGTNCPHGGDIGQMREAAVFTSDTSIIATDNDSLDLGAFTVSLWVKPAKTTGQDQQLFRKQNSSGGNTNFRLTIPANTLKVRFDLQAANCSTTLGPVTSGGELIENQWNHIAASFDGTTLAVYINGALDDKSTVAATSACDNGNKFYLGAASQGFEGSIDEVAVYGTALPATQITEMYYYQASWYDVIHPHRIVVDVAPPEISFLNKKISDIEDNGIIILSVSVEDIDSPVATVKYRVDNGAWHTATQQSDNSAAWTFEYTPNKNAWQSIHFWAVDSAGNPSSTTGRVYVDTAAPTITRDYSVGYYLKSVSDSITLAGEAIDRGSGVASGTISIELFDILGRSVSGDLPAEATNNHWALQEADWTIDYPFSTPPYGIYSVQASAEDLLGNRRDHDELFRAHLDTYGPVADVGSYTQIITDDYFIGSEVGLIGTASDLADPLDAKVLSLHLERWARWRGTYWNIIDSSGNMLQATCTACPGMKEHALNLNYRRAAEFRGTQAITVTADKVLNLDDFTLGMWVKPVATRSGWQTLIRKDSAPSGNGDNSTLNRNYSLQMHSDSTQLRFEIQSSCGITGVTKTLDTSATLPIDSFTHVMATYNSGNEKMALYLNGELDASVTFTDTPGICTIDNDVIIGENSNVIMDEVAIYNRALVPIEVYYLANPLNTGIREVNLRFRHASGSVWTTLAPDVFDPDGLKLYLSMDTDPFADVTPFAQDVTCVGNCPEQEIGKEAFAARFDGVDDQLQVENFVTPATEFSAGVWFKLDDLSANQPILHQRDGQTWLGVNTDGELYTTLGGGTLASSQVITTGTWYHTALAFDGVTLTLYLNANPVISATPAIASSDGDLLLGFDGAATYLSGALDELLIYDRALNDAEIEILATESPWLKTNLRTGYHPYIYADWYYTDPIPKVEGMYAIDLWATDNAGNASYIPNAWVGGIDLISPKITLYISETSDIAAQISCEATDFNLDDAAFSCPATGDITYGYLDADWFNQIISDTNKNQLSSLSSASQNKLVTGDYSLTACDLFDNCTSVTEFYIDLFEDANAGIPGTYNGDAHWGDYDNDGDLDVLVTGCPDENNCDTPIAQVYAQDAGSFGLFATLTGQSGGGSAWGDYDNGGDLDIVISGNRGAVNETTLYENTGSGFIASAPISDDYGQVAWGDFDNDNDLDLLVEGALYQNDGGSFSLYATLTSQIENYAAWGDY
ncbi:MAG: hypothetical protein GY832_29590, partial [Chloroflexi bacterium]|nr:hypothetical protein [Chloroflexota bacterium]